MTSMSRGASFAPACLLVLVVGACSSFTEEARSEFAATTKCQSDVEVGPAAKTSPDGVACGYPFAGNDTCTFHQVSGCGRTRLLMCGAVSVSPGNVSNRCYEWGTLTYVATDGTRIVGTEGAVDVHTDAAAIEKTKLASAAHDLACPPEAIAPISETAFAGCGQVVTYDAQRDDDAHSLRYVVKKHVPLGIAPAPRASAGTP
jgi:hypothetical protein